MDIRRIAVGRTAEIYRYDEGRVLKLLKPGFTAYHAEQEAASQQAAARAGLPVPAVSRSIAAQGRFGFVMVQIDGEPLAETAHPIETAHTLADLHARIHSKKVSGLPVLRTRLENRINAAADLSEALRQRALAMLAYLPNEDTLCHGDFHPDSVLVGAEGPVIIDWADAARGHALADVATTLIRFGEIARETGTDAHSLGDLRTAYLERYRALTGASQQAIHTWLMPVAAARLGDPAVVARDYLLGVVSGNPV